MEKNKQTQKTHDKWQKNICKHCTGKGLISVTYKGFLKIEGRTQMIQKKIQNSL
jgi:hypothetical protein